MWQELIAFNQPKDNLALRSRAWVEVGVLKVAFELTGDLEKVLTSSPQEIPARVIGLWESTCFEMFIKNKNSEEYFEFNCSSANNWNVFYFQKQKAALKEFLPIASLASSSVQNKGSLRVSFWIDLERFPTSFWKDGQMNLGLTTVLESDSGELSYWALRHIDTRANFHMEKSFIYQL
jgi:hypothetical protein